MKNKIEIIILLFLMTGCNIGGSESSKYTSFNSFNNSSENVTSEKELLNTCNFIMNLEEYVDDSIQYNYQNEFGEGKVTTNKIFIICDFLFNEDYTISNDIDITVNDNKIHSKIVDANNNQILFKIEDPNWSLEV